MAEQVDYPLNIYSRSITNSSGANPETQIFLCHADRASVSSGTWFVEHSSSNNEMLVRGDDVYQDASAGYFGTSGILLSNGSTDSRIVWELDGIANSTFDQYSYAQVEFLFMPLTLDTSQTYTFFELWGDTTNVEATMSCQLVYSSVPGSPAWYIYLSLYPGKESPNFPHIKINKYNKQDYQEHCYKLIG